MKKKWTPPQAAALVLAAVCAGLAIFTAVAWAGYQRANGPVLSENARLEGELLSLQQQAEDRQEELDHTAAQIAEQEAAVQSIREEVGRYSVFFSGDSPTRGEYIQEQMVELLDRRQNVVAGVRGQMSANLNNFFRAFSSQEYIPPEPVNVMKELLKDSVSALTGEFDSAVADVIGDVAASVLEGEDLKSAALESIGGKISDTVQGKVMDTLGLSNLVSGVTEVSSAVSTLKDIFNTTPDYALSLTLNQALDHARQVMAVLDDPMADTEALYQAIYSYNQFAACYRAARNLRDDYSLTDTGEIGLYEQLAEAEAIDRALGIYAILLREEGSV